MMRRCVVDLNVIDRQRLGRLRAADPGHYPREIRAGRSLRRSGHGPRGDRRWHLGQGVLRVCFRRRELRLMSMTLRPDVFATAS